MVKSIWEYVKTHSWPYSAAIFGILVALVVGAIAAGWYMQQGYATGPSEIVVGSMTVTSPVVAVAFGILVLGEGVGITPAAAALMILLGATAIAGVIGLTRFHPTYEHRAPEELGSTASGQVSP